MAECPHNGALTRLGVSKAHGVGVLAIAIIPKGTNVFAADQLDLTWVDARVLEGQNISPAQRRLYEDFAIRKNGKLGCPRNFNLLKVGWYLNEPQPGDEPNVAMTGDYQVVSIRGILLGEELTICYEAYSES